jgi:hypothetical protein
MSHFLEDPLINGRVSSGDRLHDTV